MTVTHGLLTRMIARPGQSAQAELFQQCALPQARAEPGTLAWFALRFGREDYGFFSVFGDEAGQQAHLQGPIAQGLKEKGPQILRRDAEIARLDILASKLPVPPRATSLGVLLAFKAKAGHEAEVVQFLRDGRHMVEEEPDTVAWFALHWADRQHYGIFGVFPDLRARNAHLSGRVPRELAKHALQLVGGMPSMKRPEVLAIHYAQGVTAEAGAQAA
jgi:quinol monooxygenase YgiN